MSTPKINAIDARINKNGNLEVAESLTRDIKVSEEYISIPLEGKGKKQNLEKTTKKTTTKTETNKTKNKAIVKTSTNNQNKEAAIKRKPGRPRKQVTPDER